MAKIGVHNGKAWINPPTKIKKEKYFSSFDLKNHYKNVRVTDYNDIHYKRLQKIISRGNVICRRPYFLLGSSGHNFVALKSRTWDCSSSISAILYGTYYKKTSSSVTGWWYHWGAPYSKKKFNKNRSLIVYTYGKSGGAAHMFMDIWWQGHRITWDNCGSRKPGRQYAGHSMWWNGGSNPTRHAFDQNGGYIKRIVIF